MISSIYLFEIINVVLPYSKTFFYIAASVAEAAVIDYNYIRTLLANGLFH